MRTTKNLSLVPVLGVVAAMWLTPASSAQEIFGYTPGTGKPGDIIRIHGKALPEQGPKTVRYGRGAAVLGAVPVVLKWQEDFIKVRLPATMPEGTYWLGVAGKSGDLKFKGPETFVVPKAEPGAKTITGVGVAQIPPAAAGQVDTLPDLAIVGIDDPGKVKAGTTVTVNVRVENKGGGKGGPFQYHVFTTCPNTPCASQAFSLPPRGQVVKIPIKVYVDPAKLTGIAPDYGIHVDFWVGTDQTRLPGTFHDANDANNRHKAFLKS